MIWICASGDYCERADADRPNLKDLVRQALGVPVRRIGRFIQLALIGSGRCLAGVKAPAGTGVYIGSARGDLDITLDIVESLFRRGLPPMPLTFVNTVSNAPCFYVASHFGLAGRSNFVCSRYFAFESALEMAVLDMQAGYMDSALVGSVDVTTTPIEQHRQRLHVAPGTPVAEASHWLWLRSGERPDGAIARLVSVRQFNEYASMLDWILDRGLPAETCLLAGGQFLDAEELAALRRECGLDAAPPDVTPAGYYDSQSGGVISAFLGGDRGRSLLHVNAELGGDRRSVMLVERLPPGQPAV